MVDVPGRQPASCRQATCRLLLTAGLELSSVVRAILLAANLQLNAYLSSGTLVCVLASIGFETIVGALRWHLLHVSHTKTVGSPHRFRLANSEDVSLSATALE